MRPQRLAIWLAASLLLNLGLATLLWVGNPVRDARADTTPAGEELAPYMANQHRHVHKLGLAIQNKNQPLASFYFTELEEGFEMIEKKFPSYDNYQIAALVKAMMNPAKPALQSALAKSDWVGATNAYASFVTACNTCHVAVKKEFVKVTVPTSNPFNQSFAVK